MPVSLTQGPGCVGKNVGHNGRTWFLYDLSWETTFAGQKGRSPKTDSTVHGYTSKLRECRIFRNKVARINNCNVLLTVNVMSLTSDLAAILFGPRYRGEFMPTPGGAEHGLESDS